MKLHATQPLPAELTALIRQHLPDVVIVQPSPGTIRRYIGWSTEDVKEVCPGVSDEQALEILDYAVQHHDAEYGITWDTFKDAAAELGATP